MRNKYLAFCCVVASISAMADAEARPHKVVKKVVVDGATFKVRIRGDEATVSRRSALFIPSVDHWRMAREAAELASGCRVKESYTVEAELDVILDCTNVSASPISE